jgi:hypothetical protein
MPRVRAEVGRSYRKEWEVNFPWLTQMAGQSDGFCKLCCSTINPKLFNVQTHEKTAKHQKIVSAKRSNIPLNFSSSQKKCPEREELKKIELEIATSACCHGSIRGVDHFTEIIVKNGQGTKFEKLRLHRTKCSKLITEVISPAMFMELKKDIAGKKFSLIVDDSTDISREKNMCVLVRYFSESRQSISTSFVCQTNLIHATAEDLFLALQEAAKKLEISLEDCVGLGVDTTNAMVGAKNSLFSRLKAVSPDCVLIKCSCHSLASRTQSGQLVQLTLVQNSQWNVTNS